MQTHAEVADIREPSRLAHLAARYERQDVFHAAAHKHVPLMEDAPEEAIRNNLFGTMNVARMAHECGRASSAAHAPQRGTSPLPGPLPLGGIPGRTA